MLIHVRKIVYTVSFLMLLVWNVYSVINALNPAPAPTPDTSSSLSMMFASTSSYMAYTIALMNWFFPTVGLGVIAIAAKPTEFKTDMS